MIKGKHSEEIKAQMYKEALDTVEAINILEYDFVIHNDKVRPTHTKWIIPNKNKDLGKGKGKQHVPSFIFKRYKELATDRIITEISRRDWNEPRIDPDDPKKTLPAKKDEYRDTEKSMYEEKHALRTDSKELREKIALKLGGKVIERYGGDDILEDKSIVRDDSNKSSQSEKIDEYLEEIGISSDDVKQSQDNLIKEIS